MKYGYVSEELFRCVWTILGLNLIAAMRLGLDCTVSRTFTRSVTPA
jgi:hypothetical protein